MKCLVVGGGGREHAMAWKLAQSNSVAQVFVAPGNAGTANENKTTNVAIDATDIDALQHFALTENIDLTVVGPEAALVAGIVDQFETMDLAIFGPSRDAARLEGSKAFAKAFMRRHHIPTAHYAVFTDIDQALAYLPQQRYPLVIKADGLAAGKGVFIVQSETEAQNICRQCLQDKHMGEAGGRIVIEDFLEGEEASFIAMVDGNTIIPLASSQDHKARDNGDKGPNTGGMGAYSPAPIITTHLHQQIMHRVIEPAVRGAAEDGFRYRGFLYAGLMIDAKGEFSVLEFNCRLGDPETQVVLPRLQSDFAALCLAACQQRLHTVAPLTWDPRVALGVVLTAGGYPESYAKGNEITGLDTVNDADLACFHAGTLACGGKVLTNGGRVLCLTAHGGNVDEAHERVYRAVKRIHWDDIYYRTDIGYRAIATTD